MAKSRQLKKWNGRGHGKYQNLHLSIAAYSQKQCAQLISLACFGSDSRMSVHEVRGWYSKCWGTAMDGIEPKEPCVYVEEERYSGKYTLAYPFKKQNPK